LFVNILINSELQLESVQTTTLYHDNHAHHTSQVVLRDNVAVVVLV